jgi:hypothetical protein
MNWDAIGAIGDFVGAMAVVTTLIYLAIQVRHAKMATADQSRIYRATAVREIIIETSRNEALRMAQIKDWGMEPYYQEMAKRLGTTMEEASMLDWGNNYYFWIWWGQYSSTTEKRDRKELEYVIENLGGTLGTRLHWKKSPISRPLLDEGFVKFVDKILAKENG